MLYSNGLCNTNVFSGKKPLNDKHCFHLLLFLIGNGCPPIAAQKKISNEFHCDELRHKQI